MNFLSRTEELILLAVWRLKEKVYNVEIRRQLKKVTASYWSFGAVYIFFVLTIPFLVLQCGTGTVNNGSEPAVNQYQERLDKLFATYDQDFIRLLNEAQQDLGKSVITYSPISDDFTIPKYMEISGTHYDFGYITGYIGKSIGMGLIGIPTADVDLNNRIIKMYKNIYPQFLEIIRGICDVYEVEMEDIDLRYMENGYFNNLWGTLFRYPEFHALTPPNSSINNYSLVGNCAVVSANVENDVLVGRNFDQLKEKPAFIMRTKLDGSYEVLYNACYNLYHWIMDGMNEKGLVMATANSTTPEEYYRYYDPYPDYPVINEHHMFRVALETCSTVDEVIELYQKVRPWVADISDHLMVIDAQGNSAVIEIDLDRNPAFFRSTGNYQVMTNTVYLAGEEYMLNNCNRYKIAVTMAEEGINNMNDVKNIMVRIRGPAFGHMSLFDIKNGLMRMVLRRDFSDEFDYYIKN